MDKVIIFDTTLRDGEQTPGVSLNGKEKINITDRLLELKVDCIEAGFPASSPGDFESVKSIADYVGNGAVVCALTRAVTGDIELAAKALKSAKKPRIHTGIGVSDIHLKYKLNLTREEAIAKAVLAVRFAKQHIEDVEFYTEDASRADILYLKEMVSAVVEVGATVINVPDTNGYAIPEEFGIMTREIVEVIGGKATVSCHCHDDLGMATANTLSALENGARQAECTINGIGERAGNASLEEIVMALKTRKARLKLETGVNAAALLEASRVVSHVTGIPVQPNKAIVGANAFSHSSGIHQDGILKNAGTYEIIDPRDVGASGRDIVLTARSGRHAIHHRAVQLGYRLSKDEVDRIYLSFIKLADGKKEIGSEELEQLIKNQ